jgi:YHS domain-containing protein
MNKLIALLLLTLSTTVFAEVALTPPQQEAATKLTAKGGLVMPLAADADSLVVSLNMAGKQATDDDLAQLKNLPKISQLNLANTAVTDAGLANIANLTNLTHLHLEKTAITDSGLANLKNLSNLVYLNLYSTNITDAGLANLSGLKNLQRLYLWQTKVTAAGADSLKQSLPNLVINRGEELAIIIPKPPEPAPAAAASAKPINTVCPVSGKPVVLPNTLAFEGKTIGFCCDMCPKEFQKDPKKFAANIKADAAPAADKKPDDKKPDATKAADKKPDVKPADAAAKPADKKPEDKKPDAPKPDAAKAEKPVAAAPSAINTKCPVSGEDVDIKVLSLFETKQVGFCCEDCQKKFLKDPAKFKDKIVADAKK